VLSKCVCYVNSSLRSVGARLLEEVRAARMAAEGAWVAELEMREGMADEKRVDKHEATMVADLTGTRGDGKIEQRARASHADASLKTRCEVGKEQERDRLAVGEEEEGTMVVLEARPLAVVVSYLC